MNTLLIPCAINQIIENKPLCINRHPLGNLFIQQSIDGFDLDSFENIYIIISSEENERYNIAKTIFNELYDCEKIKIVVLNGKTSGPADTVYRTIIQERLTGSIVIKDSTNRVEMSKYLIGKNFICGLNISTWPEDIYNIRRKSYIKINEQGNVLDIMEKRVKSEIIGVGVYGFKRCDDFIKAFEKLNNDAYDIKCLYVSHIISYLVGVFDKVFHYIPVVRYEDWSSEKAWLEIQNRYANYFLDLDGIFGINLDWYNHKDILNELKVMSSKGAVFIGFTANDESVKKKMKRVFIENGINCIQVIYGCSMSKVKKIVSTDLMIKESNYKL